VSVPHGEVWLRPAGRVIVADTCDRILLIRSEDPTIDVPVLWLTPGGACEAGESTEAAAIRELWEETGLRAAALGPPVWKRRHQWRWGEQIVDSREDYFFFRTNAGASIFPAAATPFEERTIKEFRWWSLPEMQSDDQAFFVPRQLSTLVEPLLSGATPAVPLEIGA
jgi:8-oxo-dGTP pyrophosphatase MutT (NUDIX family)